MKEKERVERETEIEGGEGSEEHKMFRAHPFLFPAAPSPANIFLVPSPLQCHFTARKGARVQHAAFPRNVRGFHCFSTRTRFPLRPSLPRVNPSQGSEAGGRGRQPG